MLNKKYKDTFNNIKVDDESKRKILEEILTHKKTRMYYPKMVLASLTIIVLFITVGVFAIEKGNLFKTLNVRYENNNGELDTYLNSDATAELNYKANIPEVDSSVMGNHNYDFEDLENRLDIKLLKSDLFGDKKLRQVITEKVDGNISCAQFFLEMLEHEKYVIARYSISLKTKYYNKDGNLDNLPYSHNSREYYIKNLETMAVISYDSPNSYRIAFDYDNISYGFIIFSKNNNDGEKEIFNEIDYLLNSLKY